MHALIAMDARAFLILSLMALVFISTVMLALISLFGLPVVLFWRRKKSDAARRVLLIGAVVNLALAASMIYIAHNNFDRGAAFHSGSGHGIMFVALAVDLECIIVACFSRK
jgi:hypothetical protein